MQIGDLVDDGLDTIGIIVDLGWTFPTGGLREPAYKVYFPADTTQNGWYSSYDLKVLFSPLEEQ